MLRRVRRRNTLPCEELERPSTPDEAISGVQHVLEAVTFALGQEPQNGMELEVPSDVACDEGSSCFANQTKARQVGGGKESQQTIFEIFSEGGADQSGY